MSKYCAEDLRNAAEDVENYSGYDEDIIADMLRFAADVLEREKKYEYALVSNGVMYSNHYCDFQSATLTRGFGEKVVKRAVGEWEEV